MREDTAVLWFGPLAILLLGAAGAFVYLRRRKPAAEAPLSAEEEARLKTIVERRE
jgi:cytochrome c-type biogenesis protein CcmH